MPTQPLRLKGIRALVIDEDASVRVALRRTFAEWGAQVTEAESGARGLVELAREREAGHPFQLIFVASAMTPVDGFEVAQVLRAHPVEHARTVLMLRPEYIVEEMARVHELGIAAYVAKPLSRSPIVGAISAVLGADAGREASTPGLDPKPKRSRILLAEDTADVAWIIRTQIEGPEYQVDVARDGAVALNLFRLGKYDLVLMDICMPNFDGYWATREIRAWERLKQLKHTPIIALTAFAQAEDPQKSMRAGLDGYLVKPVDTEKLRSVIAKYLKRK